jgi:hypothetical protein
MSDQVAQYKLADYLKAINYTKEKLLDSDDKEFSKWFKASKLTNLDIVKKYYGYSNEKAKQALDILTKEQIDFIKKRLYQGGKK